MFDRIAQPLSLSKQLQGCDVMQDTTARAYDTAKLQFTIVEWVTKVYQRAVNDDVSTTVTKIFAGAFTTLCAVWQRLMSLTHCRRMKLVTIIMIYKDALIFTTHVGHIHSRSFRLYREMHTPPLLLTFTRSHSDNISARIHCYHSCCSCVYHPCCSHPLRVIPII